MMWPVENLTHPLRGADIHEPRRHSLEQRRSTSGYTLSATWQNDGNAGKVGTWKEPGWGGSTD